jgi:murein L,D-transpeptidase YafK
MRFQFSLAASLSLLLSGTTLWAQSETPQQLKNASVPAALIELGAGEYYSPYAFVVDKKSRVLSIWSQKDHALSQVATFPIDFGRGGGNKTKNGDLNTPEGIYFLMEKLEGPSLDFSQYGKRAFTTNYPNLFDERDGKTGNGIWLHAVPDNTPLTRGSRGCVVVRNDVILDISKYVKLHQTPLVIYGEVPQVSADTHTQLVKQLRGELDQWRTAWEGKDFAHYMEYYSANFESLGMNLNKWRKYKESLNQTYTSIQVKLSEPVIYNHGNHMVMRFLQAYQSDKKSDYGEKTLYWSQEGNRWKIVAEQWNEVNSPVAYHELAPFGSPTNTATDKTASISTNQ